jgi:hypothetical protein
MLNHRQNHLDETKLNNVNNVPPINTKDLSKSVGHQRRTRSIRNLSKTKDNVSNVFQDNQLFGPAT